MITNTNALTRPIGNGYGYGDGDGYGYGGGYGDSNGIGYGDGTCSPHRNRRAK